MKPNGNTILITGGASGIGRALAEALHRRGNRVIISGRRRAALEAVAAANPGMRALTVDMGDPAALNAFAAQVVGLDPSLNVIVNNAGIMKPERLAEAPANLAVVEETIATNLLGPIRLTSALLPHLLGRPRASVVTVSSGLAFVPLAFTPTYSATKAAIHSYSMSLRQQLKGTNVEVIEIAPPYVQTELTGPQQATDPRAMPLGAFIEETMALLDAPPASGEIIVENCKPLRFAAESGRLGEMFALVNGAPH
jgi:uncharacterized oxidoreductase